MAYFDYSLPPTVDISKGMEALGDSLTEVMRRRQQQQQFEQTQKFQREQEERKFKQAQMNIEYQNRIIDERARRDELRFNFEQDERQAAAAERARKAASPQEAAAILDNARRYDPKTGQEIGRGKLEAGPIPDVGPAPTAPNEPQVPPEVQQAIPSIIQAIPGMPPEIAARLRGKKRPEPEPGAMVGPLPSPEEARRAEIQRIGAEPASEEVPDVDARLASAEAERASEEAKRARYQRQFESYREDMAQPTVAAAIPAFDKYQSKRAQFETDTASLPARQATHAAETRAAEARRPYTISFGEGQPSTTFDFQTQRYASRNEAAQRFLETLPTNMSKEQQTAARETHAAILGGADPQKAHAEFANRLRLGVQQGFKAGESSLERAKDIKVAEINSRRPGLVLQERRFQASQDKDIRKETRKDIGDWLKASGLETAPKQRASMDLSIKQLDGNPREVQAALVGMARATQGDNRFSDADYRVFVQNGGVGALDQAENTIQKLIDGDFGDETKVVAKQMAKALRSVYQTRLEQAARDGREEFVHNEIYDPQVAESVLEQRLGNDVFVRESSRGGARGGPPEVDARRRGKSGSSRKIKAPSVDEALLLLEGTQ